MIIFNGAEFLRQVLDSIYSFAHEIIIAEGADRNSRPYAKPNGSSTDETVDIIKSYPDPGRKILLIQGIWKDKIEQSNAWLRHATGDYVWQIDDDEIYKKEDLIKIDSLLKERPETTAVSFHWCHFFGGVDRIRPVNSKTPVVWRLFKYKPGHINRGAQLVFLIWAWLYAVLPILYFWNRFEWVIAQVVIVGVLFITLRHYGCTSCPNFGCILNIVPQENRDKFLEAMNAGEIYQ